MYNFEELDAITRKWMLEEFMNEELSGKPYRSRRLSVVGLEEFPKEMKKAIQEGNEVTLTKALSNPKYWNESEISYRGEKAYEKSIDPAKAAESLSITEFNTWYVRGFARRLIEESIELCQVYRAASATEPRGECLEHEGKVYEVKEIYDGHRKRYWHESKNPSALSIPTGTNCHHTIRRKK